MRCRYTMVTDIGVVKETNQDSLCVLKASSPLGEIVLAIVADGMGGLASGELASKTVIERFAQWFEQELPQMLPQLETFAAVRASWTNLIKEQNEKIGQFAARQNSKMGTTVTAILLVGSRYIGVHVGDCRMYEIVDTVRKCTTDQTVVERDLTRGLITKEQAAVDRRRNVLLQCVGASKMVLPSFWESEVQPRMTLMLCCDGFWHNVTEQELLHAFSPATLADEGVMQQNATQLVELMKERGERDNISVVLLKTE